MHIAFYTHSTLFTVYLLFNSVNVFCFLVFYRVFIAFHLVFVVFIYAALY